MVTECILGIISPYSVLFCRTTMVPQWGHTFKRWMYALGLRTTASKENILWITPFFENYLWVPLEVFKFQEQWLDFWVLQLQKVHLRVGDEDDPICCNQLGFTNKNSWFFLFQAVPWNLDHLKNNGQHIILTSMIQSK